MEGQSREGVLSANFQSDDQINKANIASNFTNLKDSLLSDDMYAFQEDVRKGNVEVLTADDLQKSFGNQMMYKPQHTALGEKIDELIEKGQTSYITEEEADFVEKGGAIYRNALKKALPVHKEGGGEVLAHVEVYVTPEEFLNTNG